MSLAPKGYSFFGGGIAGTDVAGLIKVANYFTGVLVSLGDLTIKRGKISTLVSSTTNGDETFVPEDVKTGEEIDIEILHDKQAAPPWGDLETIVITYPLRGTEATPAKKTFMGFLTQVGVSHPLKDKILTKAKLAVSGTITYTAAT